MIATFEEEVIGRWGHLEEEGAQTVEILHAVWVALVRSNAKNPPRIKPYTYERPESVAPRKRLSASELNDLLGG